jgi:glyoxylase-like metal-dependent hydrolase (beta-lactamase superfamily II)
MRVTKLTLGPLANNVYILTAEGRNESVIVDASFDAAQIAEATAGTNVRAILLTHGDHNHIDALAALQERFDVPIAIHPADAARLASPPDILLQEGGMIGVGDEELRVLHTPGHTPGSVCFHLVGTLIAGDTLFPGGPGATHGNTEHFAQIIGAIRDKLFLMPDETLVRPGHGDDTTIGAERPRLQEWIARGW